MASRYAFLFAFRLKKSLLEVTIRKRLIFFYKSKLGTSCDRVMSSVFLLSGSEGEKCIETQSEFCTHRFSICLSFRLPAQRKPTQVTIQKALLKKSAIYSITS